MSLPPPSFFLPPSLPPSRPMSGGVEGDGVGVEEGGEDIDLPNVPDQQDNGDIDQDDVPMNAG